MLLILNESGVIAGIDTTTFGYMAIFSALILYLSGGMLGRTRERDAARHHNLAALGLGVVMLLFTRTIS